MLTHVVHMLAAMLSLADRFQLQNIAGVNQSWQFHSFLISCPHQARTNVWAYPQ